MALSLDHIVIAVSDLDAAVRDYGALGFQVIRGGEHANGVTHNVLVVFEDGAYLELIAWKKPDPGNRWSNVYHTAGEGFLDYALLPDDIDRVVAAAQGRGLDIEDPQPGGRLRPDGERLDWKTARSPAPDVPFLCGDVTPRRLRVQEGEVRRQPNGVTGVEALVVAVRDVESALARNAQLLGTAGTEPIGEVTTAGSAARAASFTLAGGTRITLASPTDPSSALAGALAERGEGPFAVVFRSGGIAQTLDSALTHGARLSLGGTPA